MDCYGAYTNNPPCGAMRGFGSVQAAFAVEAIMDRLADAVGLDPVEIRVRNGFHEGSTAPTGQVIDSAAPVAELVERLAAMPLPEPDGDGAVDLRRLPGGVSNTTHGEGIRRGVGYAVAYKNVAFSEGFDDYSTARVRLAVLGGEPVATVHTAAAEVGQGLVTDRAADLPHRARRRPGRRRAEGHPGRAPPGRARRRARPTSPAARSRPPARASGGSS